MPVLKKAKIGTATAADSGRIRCSRRSAGEWCSSGSGRTRVSSPRATPAIVAWMPDACTSVQTLKASGT